MTSTVIDRLGENISSGTFKPTTLLSATVSINPDRCRFSTPACAILQEQSWLRKISN
jgi:hypothetical protein